MGKQAVNKNVLNTNNLSINIQPDFDKALGFITEKFDFDFTLLPVTWDFEERELKAGELPAYIAINPDQTLRVPFILYKDLKKRPELIWIAIAHEMYHCLTRFLSQKGYYMVDELDELLDKRRYYKNWQPYDDDSNFSVMTRKMKPFIQFLKSTRSEAFEKAVENTLAHEGGYVNDPRDAGGETNFGISKKAYPNVNIKSLTREQAKDIYYNDYWLKIKGDMMPEHLVVNVFDMAVNGGVKTAVKMMQSALGVVADGAIGTKTLDAMKKATMTTTESFVVARVQYYLSLPQYSIYGKGWLRRIVTTFRKSIDK